MFSTSYSLDRLCCQSAEPCAADLQEKTHAECSLSQSRTGGWQRARSVVVAASRWAARRQLQQSGSRCMNQMHLEPSAGNEGSVHGLASAAVVVIHKQHAAPR